MAKNVALLVGSSVCIKAGMCEVTGKLYYSSMSALQYRVWQGGAAIQEVCPDMPADKREFWMTGITPDEWKRMFGSDGE